MCRSECFGDYYRGCQHYVRHYYSGKTEDCKSLTCALSSAHAHKDSRRCQCSKFAYDKRQVVNLFHTRCDDCKAADRQEQQASARYVEDRCGRR